MKERLGFVLMPFIDERILSEIGWCIAIIPLIPFILISCNFSSNGHEQDRCDRMGEGDWKSDPAHRRPTTEKESQRGVAGLQAIS